MEYKNQSTTVQKLWQNGTNSKSRSYIKIVETQKKIICEHHKDYTFGIWKL